MLFTRDWLSLIGSSLKVVYWTLTQALVELVY